MKEYISCYRSKRTNMAGKCKVFVMTLEMSQVLGLCVDTCMCKIFKVIGINEKKNNVTAKQQNT